MTVRSVSEDTGRYGTFWSKTQNGTNQANFRPGTKLDDHPYTMDFFQLDRGRFNFININTDQTLYTEDFDAALGTFTPAWTENDQLKLINKVASKVQGSDFNGSSFLAESHQTVNLITSNATRFAKFIHLVKHGNLIDAYDTLGLTSSKSGLRRAQRLYKGYAKTLGKRIYPTGGARPFTVYEKNIDFAAAQKDAASLFLEFQYGIRPLWSDLHTSMATLAQRTVFPEKTTFHATRKIVESKEGIFAGLAIKYHGSVSKKIRVKLVKPPAFADQLHFTDPLGAGWELTPWSFIVDWVIPINNYLAAVNFAQTYEIDSMCTSTLTKGNSLAVGKYDDGNKDIVLKPGSKLPWAKSVSLVRELGILTLSNVVQSTPEVRDFDKILSWEHMANAFALLSTNATSFGRSLKF